MRPVDKGKAPDKKFKKYQEAEPWLEERLGPYCSFCEMSINHVPEVEHIEAKAKGGDELAWENLLLACKYCNTRKRTTVAKGDKHKYLWPDEDDTFHAFMYHDGIPQINQEYLQSQGDEIRQKAENLFHLVKLDNIPLVPKDKDRRYASRNEAYKYAVDSKKMWDKVKMSSDKSEYLKVIEDLAKSIGFFSVWMNIFKNDSEVSRMLISVFKGTREEYCHE